ncbi:hypothetical protein KIN20_028209 [Parelaphostrongylus tenuis]|uniref:Uncharacterized protein n=1 Tax=Parelaphostrongylus tenuis TaxID=148309 RepID=A0AAD5R0N9_PARTN|nr:hypothetical protein KIN20_028209 [Parelaphostrongylus tenuis]
MDKFIHDSVAGFNCNSVRMWSGACGSSLPVAMVYSTATNVQAQIPGIASTEGNAKAFVQRLVMQTVFDVLESQARSALLPDAVISAILAQLEVKVTYAPIPCEKFIRSLMEEVKMNEQKCIIVDNMVTGICAAKMGMEGMCNSDMVTIMPVPTSATSISGTLTTTNIIMANWSRTMWQSVLNRALRMQASGSFRFALLLGVCYCCWKLKLKVM